MKNNINNRYVILDELYIILADKLKLFKRYKQNMNILQNVNSQMSI